MEWTPQVQSFDAHRAADLLNRSRVQQEFEERVVADAPARIDRLVLSSSTGWWSRIFGNGRHYPRSSRRGSMSTANVFLVMRRAAFMPTERDCSSRSAVRRSAWSTFTTGTASQRRSPIVRVRQSRRQPRSARAPLAWERLSRPSPVALLQTLPAFSQPACSPPWGLLVIPRQAPARAGRIARKSRDIARVWGPH